MTNAFAQNIENEKTNAADLLMQMTNISANNVSSKKTSNFSNIMNNMEARTNRAKTDFEQKAKVSNTSSINKKALESKTSFEPKKTNYVGKENVQINDKKINNQDSKNVLNEVKDEKQNLISQQKNDNAISNESIHKQDNLSDINNSSPVDPSPVFSNELNANKEDELNLEATQEQNISIVPIVDELDITQNADLKEKIDEIVSNIDSLEEVSKVIESISAALDDSNLSKEDKEALKLAIDEIQSLFKNTQEQNSDVDFSNALINLQDKIKEFMTNLVAQVSENNQTNEIQKLNFTEGLISKLGFEKIDNKTNINQVSQELNMQDSSVLKKVESLINKLESLATLNNDSELAEIKEGLSQKLNEVKQVLQNDFEGLNVSEIDEKLETALEDLQKVLSKNISKDEVKTSLLDIKELISAEQKTDNKVIEVDFSNKTDILTLEQLENIDTDKILKSENIDSETMNEIISVLDEASNDIQLDQKIKIEAQKLIEKIDNNNATNQEIVQVLDDIKIEVESKQTQNQTVEEADNTIDAATVFENFSNNQSNDSNLKQDLNKDSNIDYSRLQDKSTKASSEEINMEISEADLEDVQVKFDKKISPDVKIDELEASLEKAAKKNEIMNQMMDDMMVEVELKAISSQSGALSVADEVAKLAMGENSSLNPITSAHGSVTYDSASGVSAVIKNAAQMMKTTQAQNAEAPSMNEILNQITNKLTQLKDNMGQKLTMVLRPNDLGRLSIELTSNNLGLTTQIMAQNDDVRAYIERNIDALRQQLSDAGVNVNSIQIKTAGQEGTSNYDGNQNFNREQQQENQNQQNNEQNKNNGQNRNRQETLASLSDYDMFFAKDFSTVLNKTMNYSI